MLAALVLIAAATSEVSVDASPPSLDDLWGGAAFFAPYTSTPINAPGFEQVDAGTRVVVVNGTWYLFGRYDVGPTAACPGGEISINVRASTDKGKHWCTPSIVVRPDEVVTCMFADGSAIFDAPTNTWHYIVQVLDVGNKGGWQLSHFSRVGNCPLGPWTPNAHNPVVHGGQLFDQICAGAGKHCEVGMVDEGTPEIVEKVGDDFYVTFHGYDYARKAAARGVARTADFVQWQVTGGAGQLPGDVIFSSLDCRDWAVPWAAGGCIGSGEASILRGPGTAGSSSAYMYQVIEAADRELGCETGWDTQWWPLGLVRSRTWAPSGQWEQMAVTPFVGGPVGGEPRVGCSVQYNHLHFDDGTNRTYFGFWDVSFHPANASAPAQTWHLYQLQWGTGTGTLPMRWPGPPQQKPEPDCRTADRCKATCPGYVECPSDGRFYCCAATDECTGQHACAANPGLLGCACPERPAVDCSTKATCKATCPGYTECPSDGWYYCCADPVNCGAQHTCLGMPGLLGCACGK
jgi:hypothetical protein